MRRWRRSLLRFPTNEIVAGWRSGAHDGFFYSWGAIKKYGNLLIKGKSAEDTRRWCARAHLCVCVMFERVSSQSRCKLFVWNKAFNVKWEARCVRRSRQRDGVCQVSSPLPPPGQHDSRKLTRLCYLARRLQDFLLHPLLAKLQCFLLSLSLPRPRFVAFPEGLWYFPDSGASTLSATVTTIKRSSFIDPHPFQSRFLLALAEYFPPLIRAQKNYLYINMHSVCFILKMRLQRTRLDWDPSDLSFANSWHQTPCV